MRTVAIELSCGSCSHTVRVVVGVVEVVVEVAGGVVVEVLLLVIVLKNCRKIT